MDNFEYNSPSIVMDTSTMGTRTVETTINPWHIEVTDHLPESITDGMYILYGMGGILIFFVVYMICYSYFAHMKEKATKRERDHRRINERFSRITYRNPPINEGRIFIEDFHEVPVNRNTRPQQVTKGFHIIDRQNRDAAQDGYQESSNTGEMNVPFCTPQQTFERRFFTEFRDLSPRTTQQQMTEMSLDVRHNENDRMHGWMSTPPLGFSSPLESKEGIFSRDDLQNSLCTDSLKMSESFQDQKLYQGASKLSKHIASQSSSPEGRSQSSPTSPDSVRRRVPILDCTPRRPSSWR